MSVNDILFPDRQVEILHTMYAHPDDSHAEIARRLGMAEATLRTHLRVMYQVVGVHSDKGLIVKLIKAGWFNTPQVTQPRRHKRISR